ncbi:MAG: GNAT family N-acetyltransferase [Flavobacteriaceae bacterium]|nr:GNAT family N-acetyltransferase [Flavobacteriaceae bacterium]
MSIEIVHSQWEDLDAACQIFDDAIAYQKQKGYPEYRSNDREGVKQAIADGMHYKMLIDGKLACVFNVVYNDRPIWRDKDQDDAIFLHRVITAQEFKGRRLFGQILEWAIDLAQSKNRPFVRMDTWDDNPNLVNYYKTFGFEVVEHFVAPYDPMVSPNCWGNKVVLLEYRITE